LTAGPGREEALSLEGATVGGLLTLGNESDSASESKRGQENRAYPRFTVRRGVVDLRGTRCQRFEDSGWTGPIRLDGFTYETTSRPWEWDARTRIPWLERDNSNVTQPLSSISKVF